MSVLRTKTESAVIAVNDDIITLFAIPKFSIIKPQINAPNGPKEKIANEYIDNILPL